MKKLFFFQSLGYPLAHNVASVNSTSPQWISFSSSKLSCISSPFYPLSCNISIELVPFNENHSLIGSRCQSSWSQENFMNNSGSPISLPDRQSVAIYLSLACKDINALRDKISYQIMQIKGSISLTIAIYDQWKPKRYLIMRSSLQLAG